MNGALLVAAAVGVTAVAAAKTVPPLHCEGEYTVTDPAKFIVAGKDTNPNGNTLRLQDGRASIVFKDPMNPPADPAQYPVVCAPTDLVTIHGTRKGSLKARWCDCQGQNVQVSGMLSADCKTLDKGKAKAGGRKVPGFSATCFGSSSPDCAGADVPCPEDQIVVAIGEGGSQGVIVLPAGGQRRDLQLPALHHVHFDLDSSVALVPGAKPPSLLFRRFKEVPTGVTGKPYPFYLPDPVRVTLAGRSFEVDLPNGTYYVTLENDCAVPYQSEVDPDTHNPSVLFDPVVVDGDQNYFHAIKLSPRAAFPFAFTVAGLPVGSGPVNVTATGADAGSGYCRTAAANATGSGSGTAVNFVLTLPAGSIDLSATSSSATCSALYRGTLNVAVSATTTTTSTSTTIAGATTTTSTLITLTVQAADNAESGIFTDRFGDLVKGATLEAVPDPEDAVPGSTSSVTITTTASTLASSDTTTTSTTTTVTTRPTKLQTDLIAPCPSAADGSFVFARTAGQEYRLLAMSPQQTPPSLPFQILPEPPTDQVLLRVGKLLNGRIFGKDRNNISTMTVYGFQRTKVGGVDICLPYKAGLPRNDPATGFDVRLWAANVLPGVSQGTGGCVATTSTVTVTTTTSPTTTITSATTTTST